jgi:hypothetical protein
MEGLRLACRLPELEGIDPENITYYLESRPVRSWRLASKSKFSPYCTCPSEIVWLARSLWREVSLGSRSGPRSKRATHLGVADFLPEVASVVC